MPGNCPDAGQHPGNDYYVQQVTGTIQRASGMNATIIKGLGYVGPFDWCDAKAYAAAHTESGVVNSPGQVGSALAQEAGSSVPGLSQIGDFFSALGKANTWIRVAKVVFGGVLLIIGIAHMTGADNAVASAARKVPVPI